jgi:transposase
MDVRLAFVVEAVMAVELADVTLESLEVGASPVVLHLLKRMRLQELLERFLPPAATGAPAKLSCAATLTALVSHLLLCRRPFYALSDWFARRVPECLGLDPEAILLLNDDRFGRSVCDLFEADTASLLAAVVLHVVPEFEIELQQLHNDSTSITFDGKYNNQADDSEEDRPPLITFGYNKDHRPDLKQLLYCLSVSADGAVPIHVKTYDGNTSDDVTHQETWLFLRDLVGHADFLYVADSKLCSHDNLKFIAQKHGRFLTVMPKTWQETKWMWQYLQENTVDWKEVRRDVKGKREVIYEGFEYPHRCTAGYRLFWYRSSVKRKEDAAKRAKRLEKFRTWQKAFEPMTLKNHFDKEEKAKAKGKAIVEELQVSDWVQVRVEQRQHIWEKQVGPGRPGPSTRYETGCVTYYVLRFEEDREALAAEEKRDGLFCLISNDEELSLAEALAKYKYQPFLEKRFEQLKSVFAVTPVWLKKAERIAGLSFVYYLVLLTQALLEREVRRQMVAQKIKTLPLYPEGRPCKAPTAELILGAFEGLRRHRLLDTDRQVLRTFHDPLPLVARQLLSLLNVDPAPYGVS